MEETGIKKGKYSDARIKPLALALAILVIYTSYISNLDA
jgi:hypothetical protein